MNASKPAPASPARPVGPGTASTTPLSAAPLESQGKFAKPPTVSATQPGPTVNPITPRRGSKEPMPLATPPTPAPQISPNRNPPATINNASPAHPRANPAATPNANPPAPPTAASPAIQKNETAQASPIRNPPPTINNASPALPSANPAATPNANPPVPPAIVSPAIQKNETPQVSPDIATPAAPQANAPPVPENKPAEVAQQKLRLRERMLKREKMKEGDTIKSESFTWIVIKLLGSGGFGDVYKVIKADDNDKKEYALKTEVCEGDRRMFRLKVEVCVLKLCQNIEKPERRRHFVDFIDRGKNEKFKFLVMSLVGQSLEDIRRSTLRRNYSITTGMQIAYQTLQAVYDLHELGYLHRDLKPQNFAIGLETQRNIIYMLDFGIARKFTIGTTKEVKAPRLRVKFIGTMRFASRACHNGIEQGRKDDLESWLYMAFDVLDNENGLPWKRLEKREVLACKQKFFQFKLPKCYEIVPVEFKRLVQYVSILKFSDEPDYIYMTHSVRSIAKENSVDMDAKLDWELKPEQLREERDLELSDDNKKTGSDDSGGGTDKVSRRPNTQRKLTKSGGTSSDSKWSSTKWKIKKAKAGTAIANH